MPTNNITKIDNDPFKIIQITERTRFILANSRAITPVLYGIWLVIELGRNILPTNFSQSLMIIQ